MADIGELIERVGRLEGPSREVDFAIHDSLFPQVGRSRDDIHLPSGFGRDSLSLAMDPRPAVTASLDAAIALCERVLTGWTWNIGGCPPDFLTDKDKPFGADLMGPVSWEVIDQYVGEEPVFDTANAQHSSPAIALVLALLKALQAQEGE